MPKPDKTLSEKGEDISLTKPMRDGQIPCLLVHSDRKHVPYVNQIVNCIEELMPTLGFKVNKLLDKTPPNSHFGRNFEKLAEECVLSIIVLDGFRPNVIFEYGFLRGRGRLILPVQDRKAYIATKSFYALQDPSSEAQIKAETGLTKKQFEHMREPPVGYFRQLSDRHGINTIVVDCGAELTSPEHPKCKITTEVNKLRTQILDEYARQSLETVKQKSPQFLQQFLEVALEILQYYLKTAPFSPSDIEKVLIRIEELEKRSGLYFPSTIYEISASLFETLAEQIFQSNTSDALKLYSRAVELYERILETEKESSNRAHAQGNIALVHIRLAEVREKEANLKKAIKALEEALTVRTKKDHPINYAKTQNNLGTAYGSLSEVRDEKANLEKAIKAFKKALTVFTKKDHPFDHAMTQNNLGAAYSRLAQVREKEANLKKAIKALEEALTVFTKKDHPFDHAGTQHNLGAAYSRLLEVRGTEANLKKAIKAFKKALTVFTKKDYPINYAMTQNCLGNTYGRFAQAGEKETNLKEANLKKAIKAYKKALTVRTKKDYPTKYAMTQNNLGAAYSRLAQVREKEANLKKAIKALEEALTVYTKKDYPISHARTLKIMEFAQHLLRSPRK